jgi:hypothetical protein
MSPGRLGPNAGSDASPAKNPPSFGSPRALGLPAGAVQLQAAAHASAGPVQMAEPSVEYFFPA